MPNRWKPTLALALACLVAVSGFQDPAAADRFPALLAKAEKLGMSLPALPQACAELDSIAASAGSAIKPEWSHRLDVLRSRAAVAGALHKSLLASLGTVREVPLPGGGKDKFTILAVGKDSIDIPQGSGRMTLAFSQFDPEWVVATVEPLLPKEPPDAAALNLGLFLAHACRWEAAARHLASQSSTHPLVLETRRLGLERVRAGLEKAIAARKWSAAFDQVKALGSLDPDSDAAETAKQTIHDALVAYAKDCALKKAKTEMNAAISQLEKYFPDEKDLAALIRDELRWTSLNDPKIFELTGKVGAPFVLTDDNRKDGYSLSAYCQKKDLGAIDGLAARISARGESAGVPGFAWDSGLVNLWIDSKGPSVCIGSMTATRSIQLDGSAPVDKADAYDVSVVIEKDEYVVRCNNKEAGRFKSKLAALGSFGIKVSNGTATFEQVRVRR